VRGLIRAAAAVAALGCIGAAAPTAAPAQSSPSGGTPPSGTNLLNPAISAVGWFQAEAGDALSDSGSTAFSFREVEIGFQANVDPYSRADFFVAVSPEEGVELEEGTVTFLALPAGLKAKVGKFRSNFGRFNRTHPPETPFADRPLAAEALFGDEGLSAVGGSASWLLPLPFYANLDAEVTNTPEMEEGGAFTPNRGKDLLYLGRLSTYFDLSEAANVAIGGSFADGANGADTLPSDDPPPTINALRARLVGADLTFRWKNPRRAIYRSLVAQMEWMRRRADLPLGSDVEATGGYVWTDFQFARRWHAGGRYDWFEGIQGALGFVTFNPSEFSSISGQIRRDGLNGRSHKDTLYFLKMTFSIGPHGQHPF